MERDMDRTFGAVTELGELLGIPMPRRIESFDNSNIQGADPVSAMVVFLDGKPAKAGKSYLRGMFGMCFYIVADNKIYAAYTDYDNTYYYTNDKKYSEALPEPIKEWASNQEAKIHYKYTETK
jgi:hypothetical protein